MANPKGKTIRESAVVKKQRKRVLAADFVAQKLLERITKLESLESASKKEAPNTTEGSKTKGARGASGKKTTKKEAPDTTEGSKTKGARGASGKKTTKSPKAAKVEKKKSKQTGQSKKAGGGDDVELAEAIEGAKATRPTKPTKPVPKRKKASVDKVQKLEVEGRKKGSGRKVQKLKVKAAPAKTATTTQPGGSDTAAEINTHISTLGGDATRNALVQAIQRRLQTASQIEQAELLKGLRKSTTSNLPRNRKSRVIKKFLSIQEAMANISVRKSKGPWVRKSKGPSVRRVRATATVTQVRKLLTDHEIETINASSLELVPIQQKELEVPSLSYGLERVLFNPGVYQLQDPRSRVFNFDPYLQTIMPVNEFDFTLLKKFTTSSKDKTLLSTAAAEKKKYTGSTSSMTSTLSHFHYLLSQWRPINAGALSKSFPVEYETFTALHRCPTAMFMRYKDGVYAIDADKEYDTANVLSMLGQSMEKLLTLSTEEYEQYRKHSTDPPSEEERSKSEAYHYTTMGDFLMRSQLDAHDPRVPGTGMFDLKTRAVVSIRMEIEQYEHGSGYEIRGRHGEYESYEREYYDMIRSAFLKYSLQVRMGRMDGIFVAFHNVQRIFGFQYISLPEMDYAIHGANDVTTGDAEFKLSLSLLNRVLDRATARFPEKSIRVFFETRPATSSGAAPYMYIFAEPVEEEDIEKIQSTNKAKIEDFEKRVLGLHREESEEEKKEQWESLQANVQASIENDEIDPGEVDAVSNGSEQDGADPLAFDIESEDVDEVEVEELDKETQHNDLEEKESELEGVESEEIIDEEVTTQDQENEVEEESITIEGQEEETLGDEESGKEENIIDENAPKGSEELVSDKESGKEEDLIDETTPEESEELVSTEKLDPELVENEDLIISEPTEEDITTSTSSPSPNPEEDALVEDMMAVTKGGKPILAMYLTIRNKVNGEFVQRPNNLKPEDEWKVEYALAEIPDAEKARALLEASQKRRQVILNRNEEKSGNAWNTEYINKLRMLSDKGRLYRNEVDKKESMVPKQVLDKEGDVN
ncbi:mRNA degradation protein, mitochondrial [Lachnellula cervina]|uniref:mRNA degradation protein, mitochondrial n=1 Tax=Lachnellula cervina TaxID=1316786 RepID=A0A7D8YMJ3_9HELO|nr:mRNA degradation protein, mitochondrial [Lachnellula cervina]